MITASTSKQFIARLPQAFVPGDIEKKYYPYLKQRLCIYPNLTEYLNAHIQKMNLTPVTSRSNIKQVDQRHPQGRSYRDPNHPGTFTQGEMTATFKLDSSYIIWAILNDIMIYYNTEFPEKFVPMFTLLLTDSSGAAVVRIQCNDMTFNDVSTNISIDYTTNAIETRTIECRFFVNKIEQDFIYSTQSDDNITEDDDRYIS